jgi:hypothetical protein
MSERNPYAPPVAQVDDVIERPTERPVQVVWAIRLLWAYTILGFIPFLSNIVAVIRGTGQIAAFVGGIIGTIIGLLLSVWFIRKISIGRNWARRLGVVYCGLGYIGLILFWIIPIALPIPPLERIVSTVQLVPDTLAMALICFGPGKYWFRKELVQT